MPIGIDSINNMCYVLGNDNITREDRTMKTIRTNAVMDEECEQCGYAFDTGDSCLLDETRGIVFCSNVCARTWDEADKRDREYIKRLIME